MDTAEKNYINYLNKTFLKEKDNRKIYEEIDFKYFPNDRCKCCNGSIYYRGAFFRISKNNILYKTNNKASSETNKVLNNIKYNLLVCEECLNKEFPETINKTRLFNTINKYSSFAFNIPEEVCNKFLKSISKTLDNYVIKYGVIEGKKRFEEYCNKQREKNLFEYKKTLGWTKEQFNEYNKSRAVTLDNCIKRHGVDKGTQIYDEYCKKQSYAGVKKEYFIEKYGNVEGLKKYNSMLKMKLLTLDNFTRKYGDVIGKERYGLYVEKTSHMYSEKSQILFNVIESYLVNKYNSYYATKNKEFVIHANNTYYSIDYYIEDLKIAIEFNGDYWHGNPKYYKSGDTIKFPNNKEITVDMLWENDKKRKEYLESIGIKTIVIWESEAKNINIENFLKQNNLIE